MIIKMPLKLQSTGAQDRSIERSADNATARNVKIVHAVEKKTRDL
jgi:hypothetical protein